MKYSDASLIVFSLYCFLLLLYFCGDDSRRKKTPGHSVGMVCIRGLFGAGGVSNHVWLLVQLLRPASPSIGFDWSLGGFDSHYHVQSKHIDIFVALINEHNVFSANVTVLKTMRCL